MEDLVFDRTAALVPEFAVKYLPLGRTLWWWWWWWWRRRAHAPTFPSLRLRHRSFSNRSVALPTSQLNLQPFRYFTYVTAHSPTLLSLLLRHRLFTYVSWRAAHAFYYQQLQDDGILDNIVLQQDGDRQDFLIMRSLSLIKYIEMDRKEVTIHQTSRTFSLVFALHSKTRLIKWASVVAYRLYLYK